MHNYKHLTLHMKLEFFFFFLGVTFKSLEVIPKVLRYKVVILEVSRGIFMISMVLGHIFVTLVVLMTCISIILKIFKVFCSFWRFSSYFDHFVCSRPEKWVKLVGARFDLFAYVWAKPFKIFDKLGQPVMINFFSHKINKKKLEHNLLFFFFQYKKGEKIKLKKSNIKVK